MFVGRRRKKGKKRKKRKIWREEEKTSMPLGDPTSELYGRAGLDSRLDDKIINFPTLFMRFRLHGSWWIRLTAQISSVR